MTRYALFWARYANYTGGLVRFDNLHGSNQEFVKALAQSLCNEFPTLAVLGEYFTDDMTMLKTVPEYGLSLVLATPWGYKFAPELPGILDTSTAFRNTSATSSPSRPTTPGRPAQEFGGARRNRPCRGTSRPAFLGTGATGITQGVDRGAPSGSIHRPRAADGAARRAALAAFLQSVNEIIAGHAAFRCGGNCQFVDNGPSCRRSRVPEETRSRRAAASSWYATSTSTGPSRFPATSRPPSGAAVRLKGANCSTEVRPASRPPPSRSSLPPCGAMVWHLRLAAL